MRVREDTKPLDAPLTMVQYVRMLHMLDSVNSRSSSPIVEIDRVPEWVLECIEAAGERDEEYLALSAKRASSIGPLPSQSDSKLLFVTDLANMGSTGIARVNQIMPFQKEGAEFGLRRGGRCLVADEMGLGKTLQALMIAYQYHKIDWPCLVICPSSIRFVWREQIGRWLAGLIDPVTDVQIITKGKDTVSPTAKIVIAPYSLLEPNPHLHMGANKKPFSTVICDESHYIKDPSSKRSKAVFSILKKAKRVVLLSGTPSMNNAEEMFAQIVPLLPLAKKPSLNEFRARFCVKSVHNFKGYPLVKWSGAQHREELNALLVKAVMIRRMKAEVLTQLPDKIRHRVELDCSSSVYAKQVQLMTQKWLERSKGGTSVGSSSSDWGVETMELWRLTGQTKIDALRTYLAELFQGNTDLKFILFAHHKFVMDGLEDVLVKELPPGGYMRIDGSVAQEVRAQRVGTFQNDPNCRVALLSVTSCSEGITLTAANIVIFCEMYWVPGLLEQAEARAHRVGQKDCVMCYYLVLKDSPDDVILNLLEKKKKDTSVILDGVEQGMRTDGQGSKRIIQEVARNEEVLIDGLSVNELSLLLEDDTWDSKKTRNC